MCGNGQIEGTEECDDGNSRDHDGCDAACQTENLWGCGDLVLTPATECDDDGELCMPTCQVDSYSAPTGTSTTANRGAARFEDLVPSFRIVDGSSER